MTSTRREILSLIKRRGPMTVQELSRTLEITPMGVRQHLAILERDGFVHSAGIRRGQGRPSRLYGITPEGDKLFPRTYEQLAQSLLDDLRAVEGEEKLDALFEHRRKRILEQYRARLAGKELRERVAILADARTEEGYLAEHQQIGRDRFVLMSTTALSGRSPRGTLRSAAARWSSSPTRWVRKWPGPTISRAARSTAGT